MQLIVHMHQSNEHVGLALKVGNLQLLSLRPNCRVGVLRLLVEGLRSLASLASLPRGVEPTAIEVIP